MLSGGTENRPTTSTISSMSLLAGKLKTGAAQQGTTAKGSSLFGQGSRSTLLEVCVRVCVRMCVGVWVGG